MTNNQSNIVDQFGRVHNYLRISLTERCNLRCFYCMPEEGIQLRDKSIFMSSEETIQIAKTFVGLGVNKIRLTGGEPLVKKDVANIIAELSKLPVELSLTTNGILVDKYIDTFKEAGIKSINVSLDSLQKEKMLRITRRDYYDTIVDNIHLLLLSGIKVKINVVLMKGVNDDEIIDFIRWTKHQPIDVRFIEFMPFNGNQWNWEKKVSYQEVMNLVNENFGQENIVPLRGLANDTARNFTVKNFEGSFGVISSVTNPFCDTCNRIRLTADGKIKNCLFSSNESDLLTALRNGQDIMPIIKQTVWYKKKERAGITSFNDESSKEIFNNNRSMTVIGG